MTGIAIGSETRHPGASLSTATDKPGHPGADLWVADMAWLGGDRLVTDVAIEVANGVFTSVSPDSATSGARRLRGVVLPGLVNAHSHAFHRLLRGRTHALGGDFWLWRERMYEIAETLTPESYERLATAVFVEMAMAGVTTVGEFHYLHHQVNGIPYRDANDMGHAMVRAARRAGIRISLLDAGYFTGGFGDRTLDPVQTRFSDGTAAAWLERVEALGAAYGSAADVVVGLAPHSVRAVPETVLAELVDPHEGDVPIHIHVSEQPAENRECLDATGLTPTALLDRVGLLGPGTTFVHATHVTREDVALIGRSGTMVCYCATTERDLADGVGPAHAVDEAGGTLCVGSDSHAVIDIFEEARGIELHARLATGRRGIFAPHRLQAAATTNGSLSLGFPHSGLKVGAPADFIVVGTDSARLAGMREESGLDSIVFSAGASDVTDVFVGGRQIVTDGHHPVWEEARMALDDPDL